MSVPSHCTNMAQKMWQSTSKKIWLAPGATGLSFQFFNLSAFDVKSLCVGSFCSPCDFAMTHCRWDFTKIDERLCDTWLELSVTRWSSIGLEAHKIDIHNFPNDQAISPFALIITTVCHRSFFSPAWALLVQASCARLLPPCWKWRHLTSMAV